jgi:hypothetical protein
MLQHDDNFQDDLKLVLVYSLLTRVMLKNVQRSPIGKSNYPTLMKHAFAWFGQLRQKELLMGANLPKVEAFVKEHLSLDNELETEWLDSVAELTFYIITHSKDEDLHDTIALVTNRSYRKSLLKRAWFAGLNASFVVDSDTNLPQQEFEDWYKEEYHDNTK